MFDYSYISLILMKTFFLHKSRFPCKEITSTLQVDLSDQEERLAKIRGGGEGLSSGEESDQGAASSISRCALYQYREGGNVPMKLVGEDVVAL